MNPLKLTLLLCFFTTILFGQQEYPGYVVKLEGDTLRGRIIVMPDLIKFLHENVKYKYQREELKDYGYYANRKFYSKPDEVPPAKESTIIGTIALASGDTLQDFYVHYILVDAIVGYFEYPKYVAYKAEEGKLIDLTINEGVRKASKELGFGLQIVKEVPYMSVDLIELKDFPKKGQIYSMYANRIFEKNNGFRAYNINSKRPYQKVFEETTGSFLVGTLGGRHGAIPSLMIRRSGEPILKIKQGEFDDWIIYKNDEIYTITNARDWKQMFDTIFAGEDEFLKSLEWQNIKPSNITKVLKAYGDFTL